MEKTRKIKKPTVPKERSKTIRQLIIEQLEQSEFGLTAKDLSALCSIKEKDVYEHLEHIEKSFEKSVKRLKMTPSECNRCGYEFEDRTRLTKPGRCPECKGSSISAPVFSIEKK
ncbi:MAG: transcriptional regulator [Deltaproteobacteria bacterium]|nr:transcriptional regulator [Deltaproteobacteria bacterium]